LALALLMLVAQSFSAAHYHQKDFRENLTQTVQGGEALCSLCLFHFKTPANVAVPPAIGGSALAVARLTPQALARLHALAIALVFSRGPPFSL
jgi:hypothetical protein